MKDEITTPETPTAPPTKSGEGLAATICSVVWKCKQSVSSDLENELSEHLNSKNSALAEDGSYSVSICRSCSFKGVWGAGMKGLRATTCRGCNHETAHDFYSMYQPNVKLNRPEANQK